MAVYCTGAAPSGNVHDLTYGFGADNANNGNVASWAAAGAQTFSRSFTYDRLNRISTMSGTGGGCTGLSWGYDAWGNRNNQGQTGGTCFTFNNAADTQNHLIGSPFVYDAAGNLTNDGNHTYTYDAENRISQVDAGQTASYVYDVEGRRAEKTSGVDWRDYIHDLSGRPVSEVVVTGWSAGYVYLGGSALAQYQNSTTYFVHPDHLGSTRLLTKLDKSLYDNLDYQPFGEQTAGDTGTTHKFTGKERDPESGLDNFGARYYGSSLGRFMTPDWAARPTTVPYAVFGDPQSLNLYNYVRNDPLSRIDPDGHYEVNASGCSGNNQAKCQKNYDKANQRFEQARQKDLQSRDPKVRAAAAAYGNAGEKNGVHVGFENLRGQGIKGSVDAVSNSGKDKLIDVEVRVDIGLKGKSLQETVAHEGSHVGDDINFLTSFNFASGKYDPGANITHGQTEFNAFQTGAGVTREHGFGPNDVQQIHNFLQNDPHYGPILNVPVFNPNDPDFPQ
jgi:RHS repeat-associated protein